MKGFRFPSSNYFFMRLLVFSLIAFSFLHALALKADRNSAFCLEAGGVVVDTLPETLTAKEVALGVRDAALIDLFMPRMPGFGESSAEMLREQSVKPFLLPVRSQQVYAAEFCQVLADAMEFYLNYDQNYKQNLSPDFLLLNMVKPELRHALEILAEEGTVDAAFVPYGTRSLPAALRSVPHYKLVNFLELYHTGSRPTQKIFATRKSLMRGNPVVVLLKTEGDLLPVLPKYAAGENLHPFLVVGFDQEKQAFELRSAFGAQWGRFGYAWLDYKSFSKMAVEGYVLVPEEK